MASAAILVGNSAYRNLGELACCHDDVVAMEELLRATEKYTAIEIIENAEADELKSRMREAIDRISGIDELFFILRVMVNRKARIFTTVRQGLIRNGLTKPVYQQASYTLY